jgi:hypothetical protein
MEVVLITLGVGLLIASFEIQFRYLAMAKEYYNDALKKISLDLDVLLKERPVGNTENDPRLGSFFENLGKLLNKFTLEKSNANFPNSLFVGFLLMGLYIIVLGLIYDFLLGIWNLPITQTSNPRGSMIIGIFMLGFLISLPTIIGLTSLRKITKI